MFSVQTYGKKLFKTSSLSSNLRGTVYVPLWTDMEATILQTQMSVCKTNQNSLLVCSVADPQRCNYLQLIKLDLATGGVITK